jgi:hypothetical protein
MLVNVPYNGKDQWWILSIDVEQYITTHQCMSPTRLDSYRFFERLDRIDKLSNRVDLYAEPLIDKDGVTNMLLNLRGHENDPEPFVFRKRNLPMIKARIMCFPDMTMVTMFNSYFMSNGPLTDGQRSFLHQHFDAGLVKAYTPENIAMLKLRAKNNLINSMQANLVELTQQVEKFNQEIVVYKMKNEL